MPKYSRRPIQPLLDSLAGTLYKEVCRETELTGAKHELLAIETELLFAAMEDDKLNGKNAEARELQRNKILFDSQEWLDAKAKATLAEAALSLAKGETKVEDQKISLIRARIYSEAVIIR